MKLFKQFPVITIALIALSAVVAFSSNLGASQEVLRTLYFVDPITNPVHADWQETLSVQPWRLITPIFIHFGILHFVFNMMWVWDLGKLIETKKGAGFYLLFVVLVGALSNLAQFFLTQSALFGGMSGVVYGLFAYVWIRGRYDPNFGIGLHKTTVHMMLAWFVLCWTGWLGPIANWAHTMGLLAGAVWAYMESGAGAAPAAKSDAHAAQHQRLVQLSTSDMLQIEEKKQWVKEHAPPDLRNQYGSVAGKLKIINAILNQHPPLPLHLKQQRSLDIAFADALMQESGAQWAMLESGSKRTLVLVMPALSLTIFPLVPVVKLLADGTAVNLQQIFNSSLQALRQPRQHQQA